jgi:signal transduction histidine kinase
VSPIKFDSIGTRLALGNGALLVALILVISAVFYFGTVGVIARSTDGKIVAISKRLQTGYGLRPVADLIQEIRIELTDGIDSDTEIFLVISADRRPVAGNLSRWPVNPPLAQLFNQEVIRDGRPSSARLYVQPLPQGGFLYVGRDLSEQRAIRALVVHALEAAIAVSLALVIFGAWLSRRQIEKPISAIRRTVLMIESGNLAERIPVSGDDEFARLGADINHMLDRLEQLMNGVRQVSNAIAHDLRTPLGRMRARLDEALRRERSGASLQEAARTAIDGIDDLIVLLNKLLQIAEAEAGMRADPHEPVNLRPLARDMVELYDAAAEEAGVRLLVANEGSDVWARGDRDLLATALASLIDNAIKHAGRGARVEVAAGQSEGVSFLVVRDDGPGVPAAELPRLTERFYRLDRSRRQPGNGLGLAIVSAIAKLHGGGLELSNAHPGLRALIRLPIEPPPKFTVAPAKRAGESLALP